jgi:hypothetical protein
MKHHKTDGPPCSHMEGLLNQAADGSSRGLKLWYALSHAANCVRCGAYLHRLRETLEHLKLTKKQSPPPDILSRLEASIPSGDAVSEGTPAPGP